MFSGVGTPFSSALEIAGVGPDAAVRARGNNILYTCYRIQSSAAPSDSELLDGARIAEVNENSLVVRATQPQPTKGFTITRPGKRLKSRSADHSSRTPCCWHRAAMRASWTCGPAIRPLARIVHSAGQWFADLANSTRVGDASQASTWSKARGKGVGGA